MKFKVGDRVQIRHDLTDGDLASISLSWMATQPLRDHRGKLGTVTRIDKHSASSMPFAVKVDNPYQRLDSEYWWKPEYLIKQGEPVSELDDYKARVLAYADDLWKKNERRWCKEEYDKMVQELELKPKPFDTYKGGTILAHPDCSYYYVKTEFVPGKWTKIDWMTGKVAEKQETLREIFEGTNRRWFNEETPCVIYAGWENSNNSEAS